jgi:photosystem II stability/assembly factor-like uncharacterized protein
VTTSFRLGRRPALAALAALLFLVPATARSDDDDIKKQIAEVEKQIAELQKKLDALKNPTQASVSLNGGTIPESAVKKMNWRSIGPANMGGRITAIAVVESDPTTYYIATASGGLLKTVNNGTTFTHLFDKESTVSIGDIAVAQSDPKIVWVGTGEHNPRNSVSYGDGVYKSEDGGKKWTNMGLKQSFQIGKILIHPKDANIVYVGALGRLYGPNEERGLFKTEDGGKTWKHILKVDDKTGVIDMRMDPFDPNTLLVGMWERKRDGFDTTYGPPTAWYSPDQYGPEVTYGPGGGLFRSTDAGNTWKKLTGEKAASGLPTVKTGRIGIDYSRKTKGLVYAIIDTENVGKGRPPLTVYMGLSSDSEKGGGVRVTDEPEADTPVGKGGLKKDDIITALDGEKIADYDAMIDFMAKKKPNDVVKFTVKRGNEELTLDVKLAPRPTSGGGNPQAKGGGGGGRGGKGGGGKGGGQAGGGGGPGKSTQTLLPGFLPEIDLANFDSTVKVGSLPKGGQAEKAGVKPGMEVVSVDGKDVGNFRDFRNELRTSLKAENPRGAGDKVTITFRSVDKDKKETKLTAELALEMMEFAGAFGGRGQPNRARPFLLDGTVGGQQANVQNDQGKDGVNSGGVFVSKDNGESWKRVNSLNPRPMYFSNIRVDPNDDKTLYVLGDTTLWKSTNGGERFVSAPARGVHPDHHALWINPKDSRHLIIGCDGGFYVSYDKGETWDHLNVLALGQFYHVAVDNKRPYNVYGGLQDNGSWGGPSHTLRGTGPVNDDWMFLNGGDGFVCRVDSVDPDIVYAESQGGAISRRNLRTGETRFIRGQPVTKGEALRYNWNTPFILSNHNPNIFYSGAQYVFRSINRGENQKAISPDLTSSKKATISAIAESPRNPDILWAGTDDGNVWVTRDGGQKWVNVLDKLQGAGLPGPRWVSSIEPSRAAGADGRCYVCIDGHRSDDDRPYIFVTEDFGQSWKPIMSNLPSFGSTRVLREDIVNQSVLYCGTEFGIWASLNRGASWANINGNLPTVAVHEVAQPTTASEIVVATHGRSVWVVDVNSIRQMPERTLRAGNEEKKVDPLKDEVTLFEPAPVVRWKLDGGRGFPYSREIRKFYGTNPELGASLEYMLTKPAKSVSLKVTDVNGKAVREFRTAPTEAGFHSLRWNLSGGGGGGGFGGGGGGGGRFGGGGGAVVPAGGYRVTLTVDGKEYAQALIVENDPKADPKAIISFDQFVPGGEDEDDGEILEELRDGEKVTIVPFIPKAKD